jgi:ABC-2 type transport system ATP-binding protein
MLQHAPQATAGSFARINHSQDAAPVVRLRKCKLVQDCLTVCVKDLQLSRGSKLGIVGPNGAGKTSLLAALAGFRRGAEIDGEILGQRIQTFWHDVKMRRHIGIQLPNLGFQRALAVHDIVRMHTEAFQHVDQRVRKSLELESFARERVDKLSRGQRQRLELYVALAHSPSLAILDEPTESLDSIHSSAVVELLREHADQTVLFTSHLANELALADMIMVMNLGAVAYIGTVDNYIETVLGKFRGRIEARSPAAYHRLRDVVENSGRAARCIERPDQNVIEAFGGEALNSLFKEAIENDAEGIRSYAFGPTTLDDVLRYTASLLSLKATHEL